MPYVYTHESITTVRKTHICIRLKVSSCPFMILPPSPGIHQLAFYYWRLVDIFIILYKWKSTECSLFCLLLLTQYICLETTHVLGATIVDFFSLPRIPSYGDSTVGLFITYWVFEMFPVCWLLQINLLITFT